MEEKERYYSLIDYNSNFTLRDYETGNELTNLFDLDDLLNQQSKRIKELEKENQQLKQQLDLEKDCADRYWKQISVLEEVNNELKQQLHDLPKKIVEEIKDIIKTNYPYMTSIYDDNILFKSDLGIEMKSLSQILQTILKKYGGGNE